MKLIHIVPTANNELIGEQGMYMFLTHLVFSNSAYAHYAEKYWGYKILDNSLIECGGEAFDINHVLDAADIINADEIILPDVFQNGPQTLKAVERALKTMMQRGIPRTKYKIMAVCQGFSAGEFSDTFHKLETMSEIDVIGIPKVCAKLHPEGRPYFEYLWEPKSLTNKQIHLLGIWYSFAELFKYKYPESIRSVDSCLAAYLAYNHLMPYDVRADGFTIDLDHTRVNRDSWIECMPDQNDKRFFEERSSFLCSHIL